VFAAALLLFAQADTAPCARTSSPLTFWRAAPTSTARTPGALSQRHGPRPRGPRPPPRERMYMRSPISTTMTITPAVPPIPCPPSPPKPRTNAPLGECAAASDCAAEVTSDSPPKGSAGAEHHLPASQRSVTVLPLPLSDSATIPRVVVRRHAVRCSHGQCTQPCRRRERAARRCRDDARTWL